MNSENPICLFDSGIGGLTVLKKLIDKYPGEKYIYLADLARVPFGDKKKEEIEQIAKEIIAWLLRFNPKLIIMACNTSSAILSNQLSALNSQLKVPIYGIIEECTKYIAKFNYSKVSVWATKLVVESNVYKKLIQKANSKVQVEEISCPKLVPMIESLTFTINERNKIIQEYLDITSKDSEALILGCTHYPHIQEDIENLTSMKVIDPGDSLIKNIGQYLNSANNMFSEENVTLYTTAQLEKLQRFSRLYLGGDFNVGLVSLKKMPV